MLACVRALCSACFWGTCQQASVQTAPHLAAKVVPADAALWLGRPPAKGPERLLTPNVLDSRTEEELEAVLAVIKQTGKELQRRMSLWAVPGTPPETFASSERPGKQQRTEDAPADADTLCQCGQWLANQATWAASLAECRELANKAMMDLWMLVVDGWEAARAIVLSPIRIIYMTHDVALKILGKCGDSVCKLVMREKMPHLIIVDEGQRSQLMSLLAWAASAPMLVALGDPLQKLPQESSEQKVVRAQVPGLEAAGEAGDKELWSSLVTYHSPDFLMQSAATWTLTTSKRTGEPLLGYCRHLFPDLHGFRAMPGLRTDVSIIKFTTPLEDWLSVQEVCEAAGIQAPEPDAEGNRPVIWNSKLFSAVLMRAVECLLHHEANSRSTPEQPVLLISSALRRVLGPLRLFVEEMLAWDQFYASTGLQRLGARHVALRTSGHITGPTYPYVIVLRHRRTKGAVPAPDEGDDAHRGLQQHPAVNYVQITRASVHATVFCEDSTEVAAAAKDKRQKSQQPRDTRRKSYHQLWEIPNALRREIPVASWETHGQYSFPEMSQWMQRGYQWQFPELPAEMVEIASEPATHNHFTQRNAGWVVASSCTQSINTPVTKLVPRLGQLPVVQADFVQARKDHIATRQLATAATFSVAGGPKTLPDAIQASWGHSIVKGLPIHGVWVGCDLQVHLSVWLSWPCLQLSCFHELPCS